MAEKPKQGFDTAVDLLRKGATLLKEPCPKCGGVQVRYKERTFCVNCGNILEAVKIKTPPIADVILRTRDSVLMKLQETSNILKDEKDTLKQTELATLILKYLEIIEKTKPSEGK